MIDRIALKSLKKELKRQRKIYDHLFGDDVPVKIVSASIQVGINSVPVGFDVYGVPRIQTTPVFEEVTKASLTAKVLDLSMRIDSIEAQIKAFERAFGSQSSDDDESS